MVTENRRVTLPHPLRQSCSAAGSTILPLCRSAPRCVCVSSALPSLQLFPQDFTINKKVFSVNPPRYIRIKMSARAEKQKQNQPIKLFSAVWNIFPSRFRDLSTSWFVFNESFSFPVFGLHICTASNIVPPRH